MTQSVSIRRFADLDGCDESLVRRAIKKGQLTADHLGGLDPELAGTGWRRGNRQPVPRCPTCKRPLADG